MEAAVAVRVVGNGPYFVRASLPPSPASAAVSMEHGTSGTRRPQVPIRMLGTAPPHCWLPSPPRMASPSLCASSRSPPHHPKIFNKLTTIWRAVGVTHFFSLFLPLAAAASFPAIGESLSLSFLLLRHSIVVVVVDGGTCSNRRSTIPVPRSVLWLWK